MKNRVTRPNNIGRRRSIQTIDGKIAYFTVVDEIVRKQQIIERDSGKLIYLQKIQFEDRRGIQYRFCYYMLGLRSGARGRWVFGQYALMIPAKNLEVLIREARKRRWKGF